MNRKSREPERKRDNTKAQIIFSSIVLLADLIIELFAMVNYPTQILAIGIFGLIGVGMLYLLVTAILQMVYIRECEREEEYQNLFKSEKASYLLLRQSFENLENRMNQLERNVKVPTEEIINAQKAVAKITINRSKENADAVLNGNDLVMETLADIETKLEHVSNDVKTSQKAVASENVQAILLKQQEIMTSLKDMQVELQRDMMSAMNRPQAPVVMQAPVMAAGLAPTPVAAPDSVPVQAQAVEPVVEEAPVPTEMSLDSEIPPYEEDNSFDLGIEEPSLEEAAIDLGIEEPAFEEALVEEVEEAVANEIIEEAEPVIEEVTPEPVVEEVAPEPAVEEVAPEPVVEEAFEELVVEEEKPDMPDLSDPGHLMTPEEIAAMVANSDKVMEMEAPKMVESTEEKRNEAPVDENGLTELEKAVEAELAKMDPAESVAAVAAEEPLTIEEELVAQEIEAPAEEEKPAMPDLSDPNKMMSPEEIAALIANM